ncbi:MAG: MBL fold metallo-hydrolase, partial [Chromatiales bacterium]|nr:MBL fold metallo-hydrolase [Chromatiales bacterium]
GWNTMLVDGQWVPTFPQAEYLFAREEWEHWQVTDQDFFGPVLEDSVGPIIEAGLAQLVETDHRVTDEVWLEPTPGHTPGHVSVRIHSLGEDAVITGDMTHHPCQFAHPEWAATVDHDPEQSTATRRSFYARYTDQPMLVIGTHFAAPTAGHIVRDGETYKLEL